MVLLKFLCQHNLWMLNFKSIAFFVKDVASLGGREKRVQPAESVPWSSRPPG